MPDKHDTGLLIQLIGKELDRKINQELEPFGITTKQGRFLGYLNERRSETVSQREIQEHFEISHPTTVGIIKRLEEKKLIATRMDEKDKRNKIVELTPEEEKIHRRMKDFKEEADGVLLTGFTDEEKETLSVLLERVYRNLNKDSEHWK